MTLKPQDIQPDSDPKAQRAHLVALARDIVRNRGLEALDLSTLASETNTPEATLRALFNDRAGLILALYESWVQEWQQRLMAALPGMPPEALVRQAAHIYRELACSDRALFLASATPLATDADLFGLLARSSAFELFANFIKEGMAQRRLRVSADPDATVRTLWAGVHGAVTMEVCGRLSEQAGRQTLDEMVALLSRGMQS